jgi:hypothetical protein
MYAYYNYDAEEYCTDDEFKCRKCEEKEERLEQAGSFLKEVIEQIYSKKALDNAILEHCLDELCAYLDVQAKIGELQIERKGSALSNLMKIAEQQF